MQRSLAGIWLDPGERARAAASSVLRSKAVRLSSAALFPLRRSQGSILTHLTERGQRLKRRLLLEKKKSKSRLALETLRTLGDISAGTSEQRDSSF